MTKGLPTFPLTRTAQAVLLLGVLALLVSLWAQTPMWAVEFGMRPAAAGGGEYMVALVPTFGFVALFIRDSL